MKFKLAVILFVTSLMIFTSCTESPPKEEQKLDPEWVERVSEMKHRELILEAHNYTNYLWCEEAGRPVLGLKNDVFQTMQDRWNALEFDEKDKIDVEMKKLVNDAFNDAKSIFGINHTNAHRVFHQLDYWVLEVSVNPVYKDKYSVMPFKEGQLRSWKR